jgi:hypothetical protein
MIVFIPLNLFSFCFGCSSFLLHNQALPLLAIGDYASSAKHLLILQK